MTRLVAVQMDPIEALNHASDSTLALIAEADRRGWDSVFYRADTLSMTRDALLAEVFPVKVDLEVQPVYQKGAPSRMNLQQADVVLMRQDPPFDMNYISVTHMLETLMPKTLVVNNPASVRNNPEKLIPLQFPEYIPEAMISLNAEDIRAFHREHGDVILKPLHGFAGHGVFVVRKSGENLEALLEQLLGLSNEPLIIQRFLPEVATQEKRVLIVGGEYAGAFIRVPPKGEIRSNLRVGGRAEKVELNKRQREIIDALCPGMEELGITLAGVDLIGDYLIEVNITSPTGLRQVRQLTEYAPEVMFWDKIEGML